MRALPLVFAVLCASVLFVGLDRVGYLDQREARDAEIARELIASREVLTPLYGMRPFLDKAIPAYALEAAASRAGERAAERSRQARAALAVVLLLVVASIGGEHFGARAGWFAACAGATTLALPLAARTDTAQLGGTLLSWLAVAGFADAAFGRRSGREARLVVSWGALAAALMISGPLAVLWPIGAVALYSRLSRDRGLISRIRPIAGLALVAGIGLPWYGALTERYGAAFLAHAPFFPYAEQPRGAWYAGPALALSLFVAGLFPWSAMLPGAILQAATGWRAPGRARRAAALGGEAPGSAKTAGEPAARPAPDPVSRESREEHAAHFFIACLIAALVPLALWPSPPMSAVLPLVPAAALLCGRFLDHAFEDASRLAAQVARAALMLGLAGTAGGLMLVLLSRATPEPAPAIRLVAVVLFGASWLPFLASFARRAALAAALFVLPVAAGAPLVSLRLLPAMERWFSSADIAAAMTASAPPHATLILLGPDSPTLRLALRRNIVVAPNLATALRDYRAEDGAAYLAFRSLRERDVARAANAPLEVLLRSPTLVLARVRPAP